MSEERKNDDSGYAQGVFNLACRGLYQPIYDEVLINTKNFRNIYVQLISLIDGILTYVILYELPKDDVFIRKNFCAEEWTIKFWLKKKIELVRDGVIEGKLSMANAAEGGKMMTEIFKFTNITPLIINARGEEGSQNNKIIINFRNDAYRTYAVKVSCDDFGKEIITFTRNSRNFTDHKVLNDDARFCSNIILQVNKTIADELLNVENKIYNDAADVADASNNEVNGKGRTIVMTDACNKPCADMINEWKEKYPQFLIACIEEGVFYVSYDVV